MSEKETKEKKLTIRLMAEFMTGHGQSLSESVLINAMDFLNGGPAVGQALRTLQSQLSAKALAGFADLTGEKIAAESPVAGGGAVDEPSNDPEGETKAE